MTRRLAVLAIACAAAPCEARAVSHADLIADWSDDSLRRGEAVYQSFCVTCHGDSERPGTLPTSRAFHREALRNGGDPHAMYLTVTKGYGQMPPWPNFSAREVYDVIHFLRETQIRPHNPSQYVPVTRAYLDGLPKDDLGARMAMRPELPPWRRMDYGPALFYTLQVAPGNIAQKGIAIRLDPGAGGVVLGRAWMLYEHDTLRMAAAWTGSGFCDWKSIAFDQSHETHPSIAGNPPLATPDAPGVGRPGDGLFEDARFTGADGRRYGPMPAEWARYRGLHLYGERAVLSYTVGDCEVLEGPGFVETNGVPVFTRTFNLGTSRADVLVRLAPAGCEVRIASDRGGPALAADRDLWLLRIPSTSTPCRVRAAFAPAPFPDLAGLPVEDLGPLTRGGPPRWPGAITVAGQRGREDGPLAVDAIPVPNLEENPWNAWMRLGGFDFLPGGRSAAVCTWLGDVWLVDGIDGDLSKVTWRRIASGLFQPLGVKVVDGAIHVCCRDQIARLHDRNGDGEVDFIESFNSDHQVTEHFHEFAMGLQTDQDGNFYYTKSACHGKRALVPHHGTLLRVSRDGRRTDILATGFRAANGVCVNADGTIFVTDQEGFWMPENRINLVRPSQPPRFYGNLWCYEPPASSSDEAVEPPLCWISNEFDRSPAELVRVESPSWGPMNGLTLNLSYGMGRLYAVLAEESGGRLQGGLYRIPLPEFGTGIMRGRFHPGNGHLYACGMYAWAGNRHEDGGFLRLRATGTSWRQPVALRAEPGALSLTFSDALDPVSVRPSNVSLRVWGLVRSERYGSPHTGERTVKVESCVLEEGRTVRLSVPTFGPTLCYALAWSLRSADGHPCSGKLHGTLHPR